MNIHMLILMMALSLAGCANTTLASGEVDANSVLTVSGVQIDPQAALNQIQQKIDAALDTAFITHNTARIDSIEQVLNALADQAHASENLNYYTRYWAAYLAYFKSLYLASSNKEADEIKATLERSLKYAEAIDNKDTEVYTILASATSFYFQYIPRQEFMVYFKKVSDYMEQALELDPNNVRANYVNASYDFYTPSEYGGGQKAEALLLKGLQCEVRRSDSPFAPTWGKDLTYELIIQHYKKEKQLDVAEKYLAQAQKEFPNNYMISKIKL